MGPGLVHCGFILAKATKGTPRDFFAMLVPFAIYKCFYLAMTIETDCESYFLKKSPQWN